MRSQQFKTLQFSMNQIYVNTVEIRISYAEIKAIYIKI